MTVALKIHVRKKNIVEHSFLTLETVLLEGPFISFFQKFNSISSTCTKYVVVRCEIHLPALSGDLFVKMWLLLLVFTTLSHKDFFFKC